MKLAFNLLPWREELERQARQTYVRQSVLAGLLGAVIVGAGYFGMSLVVAAQEARNERIVKANAEAQEKIKEITDLQGQIKVLNERKKVVESLQNARNQATRIMEQLGIKLPEGVFLLGLKQTGAKVTLNGVALNQSLIATTMSSLDESEWFANPTLLEIKSIEAKSGSGVPVKAQSFVLDIQYTNPEEVMLPNLGQSPDLQVRQKSAEAQLPPSPPPRIEAQVANPTTGKKE